MHAQEETPEKIIQPMALEDLAEVIRIERQSFPKPWSKSQFEQELRNPISTACTVKVTEGGRTSVAAYIVYWVVGAEAHILNIAVRPELRRQGIATWLLETVLEKVAMERVFEVYLEVRKSNTAARNLYRKLGFKEAYERKNYYGDEDAVVMVYRAY